jgi:D-arabinose 1-dehydrogenase-like Zn-dependent alcohol dehydrogenase
MKAAIVQEPGRLVVTDIPDPVLGPYDARCEVLYGAVCTGTDLHLIDGQFPWPVRYPTVLGHESIGRVVEVGDQVRNYQVGDLITRVGWLPPPGSELAVNWGGFVEVAIARDHRAMQEDGRPESEWRFYRINQTLPAQTDPAAATMMITWRETFSYITRLGVTSGSRVLIIGSGGNGLAFAAHAANLGAEIITLVGSEERLQTGLDIGVNEYLSYRTFDPAEQFGEQRFDFIIDAVGRQGGLDQVLPWLRPDGKIGIYGLDDWGSYTIDPKRARGTFTYYNGGYDEAEAHDRVVALMQSGKLNARHWLNLDSPFRLDTINEAFDALRKRRYVKALVRIR